MTPHLINSIKGTVNIVTGCAEGLGKATLKRLLDKGCSGIIGIDHQMNDKFLQEVEKDDRVFLGEHDTQDEAAVENTLDRAVRKFGRLDNLINVAGISAAFSLISKGNSNVYGQDHFTYLMQFNPIGAFNISRLAVKYMVDKGTQRPCKNTNCIVHASCISTEDGIWGQSGYAASKGAIDSMTLGMAREFAPHGIRTNTISVGYFDTKLMRATSPELQEYVAKDVNLLPRRLGDPDEFVHLVQTILENQMLNGACIRLDAGARPNMFS